MCYFGWFYGCLNLFTIYQVCSTSIFQKIVFKTLLAPSFSGRGTGSWVLSSLNFFKKPFKKEKTRLISILTSRMGRNVIVSINNLLKRIDNVLTGGIAVRLTRPWLSLILCWKSSINIPKKIKKRTVKYGLLLVWGCIGVYSYLYCMIVSF